jgi:hypothetical protein
MACGPNVDQAWRGGMVARSCPAWTPPALWSSASGGWIGRPADLVVGRDRTNRLLRFSAGCGSSGSARHGSSELHSSWSAKGVDGLVVLGWFGSVRRDADQLGRTTAESRPPDVEGMPRSWGQRRSASRTLPRQGRLPPAAPTSGPARNRLARGEPWRGLGQGHPPV